MFSPHDFPAVFFLYGNKCKVAIGEVRRGRIITEDFEKDVHLAYPTL